MRAAQPKRKVKLSIMSGGQEVMKKILPVVKPSEMISVEIPAEKTAALSDDITVSIEEA